MISSETIDAIRNKSDIVEVVSAYVALKKRGKNYLGLCPFHSEKTPSFTVSQEKQLFHCFGCNEGGNVFAFLMKIENIDFVAAAEELANKLGIPIKKTGTTSYANKGEKEKYYDVMDLAHDYFKAKLKNEPKILKYLAERGVSEKTMTEFGLGWAEEAWDNLYKHLISRGVAPAIIEKVGLVLPREGKEGFYDRFRGRIIFPIFDIRGRVIAFGGRIVGQGEPKYLNSPDTPLYNKGYTLYGLNFSKEVMKEKKYAILVEGYMDAIACFQAGFTNVVASSGTALTLNQVKLIARFTDNVLIAYDADTAGTAATERSVEIIKEAGLNIKVASFAGGKDPDEIIRKNGKEAFANILRTALPWLEYKIKLALSRFNLKEIEARAKALRSAAEIIAQEKDKLIQAEYIKLMADEFGIEKERFSSEVKRFSYYNDKKSSNTDLKKTTEKPSSRIEEAEKSLLKFALEDPNTLAYLKDKVTPANFANPVHKEIAEILFQIKIEEGPSTSSGHRIDTTHFLLENLPSEEAKQLITKLMLSDIPITNKEKTLEDCINTLKSQELKTKMDLLRSQINEAEKQGEAEKVALLNRAYGDLFGALKSLENSEIFQ